MRILHILDHSLPLLAATCSRWPPCASSRALGWQTLQLTTPRRQGGQRRRGRRRLALSSRRSRAGVARASVICARCGRVRRIEARTGLRRRHPPRAFACAECLAGAARGSQARHPGRLRLRALWKTPPSTTARPRATFAIASRAQTRAATRGHHDWPGIAPRDRRPRHSRRARDGDSQCRRCPRVSLRRCAGSVVAGKARAHRCDGHRIRGSFYAYEGLDLLLEAAALLLPRMPDLRVLWWAAVRGRCAQGAGSPPLARRCLHRPRAARRRSALLRSHRWLLSESACGWPRSSRR